MVLEAQCPAEFSFNPNQTPESGNQDLTRQTKKFKSGVELNYVSQVRVKLEKENSTDVLSHVKSIFNNGFRHGSSNQILAVKPALPVGWTHSALKGY